MDSCKCPITNELFEDPVIGDDGHTYERKAITEWLTKNGISPITRQPMNIDSLKANYTVKKMIEELRSVSRPQQAQYRFELDVDIRKIRTRPLFQGFGKLIYECNPGSVMLLQEYAPHGDLSELLRENGFKPTERVLRKIFEQICDAMICLVNNGIVHGDLACRNVLVFRSNPIEPKENLVKLTDFGLTRGSTVYSMIDSPSMSTMTIIPVRYAAPEILRNADRTSYSEKSDVYSMGVLMWEACSYGQLPYSSLHSEDDVRQRKLNDDRLPQPTSCSDQLWTIINECWQQESLKRPTFEVLKESLLMLEIELTLRVISQEPIAAKFPCEYCQQLCSADELETHEVSATME
ncbi:unnamed protein product [Rotaria sp. Silwood1]|nr:unnamed protein product [Rotaria sp. Silwood1]CAF5074961.1 unnamed protein product [Rotaria sp. Silwood1]